MIKILSQLDTLEAKFKATTDEFVFPHINKASNGEITCFKEKITFEDIVKPYIKDISKAVAGDMVSIVNGNPIVYDSKYASKYLLEHIDGIVVIPSAHRENGRPVIMSLHDMSLETPEQGTDKHSYMCWGGYNIETSLKNYTNNYGYLPVDKDDTYKDTKYNVLPDGSFYTTPDNNYPSPYNADGSRNEAFFVDDSKCYSDMNGEHNTHIIFTNYAQYDKEIGSGAIENSNQQGHYPAFVACKRYRTKGTESGEWYLPAEGELAYMRVRQGAINDTLIKLGALTLGNYNNGFWYWSSTEYSSNDAWCCDTYDGRCNDSSKDSDGTVRAFRAL